MSFNLEGYVDVATRLKELFERYPSASVVADPPCIRVIDGRSFIEVTVSIHCNDDDNRMSRASAWEPFPGKSNFTRDSEAMNAETSAVGRACGLLGIGIRSSVASLEEVRARRESQEAHPSNQQADPRPRKTGQIVNKYAKSCGRCGTEVAVGAGVAIQHESGVWRTYHKDGDCPE